MYAVLAVAASGRPVILVTEKLGDPGVAPLTCHALKAVGCHHTVTAIAKSQASPSDIPAPPIRNLMGCAFNGSQHVLRVVCFRLAPCILSSVGCCARH